MTKKRIIDLREATLEEFRSFFFSADCQEFFKLGRWADDPCPILKVSPSLHARRYSQLFGNGASLVGLYDDETLENGCQAMFGPILSGNLAELIWGQDISLGEKETLIHSMYVMYRDFFAVTPLETSCEMWWDPLAYAFNPLGTADPERNPEHRAIQNAMFETLCKILNLDAHHCQVAALHGMNHVAHPRTEIVIEDYLKTHSNLNEELRGYARLCSAGQAL
ncbi:hypothetical protein [Phycobacter sp. K97]|uniref:hypothetical protein n=1 Tax=Phycobacter sedimenti TaxID=3133977 RepID=UPI00311E45F9